MFRADEKIYQAALLLENNERDTSVFFPTLERAVHYFLVRDCSGAVQAADCILDDMNYSRTDNVTICEGEDYHGHTVPGTYVDSYSAANGCDSVIITVLNVMGGCDNIRTVSLSDKFTVYPNPGIGRLQISLSKELAGDYQIEIFNELGHRIQSVQQNAQIRTLDLDISGYPAGVYLIKLTSKGESYFSKVVKN